MVSTRILSKDELKETRAKICYILSTDVCLEQFSKKTKRLNRRIYSLLNAGGGRFLRGETLYEDAVKTLLTTNASWSFTKLMCENLIFLAAAHRNKPNSTEIFPTPKEVRQLPISTLQKKGKLGYRAVYLHNLTDWFLANEGTYNDTNDIIAGLTAVKGLGPYSINHISVLLGNYSTLPLDSEVRAFCKGKGLESDTEIETHYEKWKPYQFLGYKLSRVAEKCNWIG